MQKPLISIVIPLYNEAENLKDLHIRLNNLINSIESKVRVEVIFVDDYSNDNSIKILKELCSDSLLFKYIRLSKNFGSHIAIISGLKYTKGDAAVFLAADLQDPPELIDKMIELWENEYKVVWAVRSEREKISLFSKLLSKTFYKLLKLTSSVYLPPTGADFALLDRKVIDALLSSTGTKPSLGMLIAWLGFNQAEIPYIKEGRKHGKTKWTVSKKLNAFSDAFVGFTYVPLRLMSYIGLLISISGFAYAFYIIFRYIFIGYNIAGWASLMVILLVISGILMIMLGIIGEYLWRNIEESRKRPLFIIEENSENIN
jgi:polyisoprenyl-phosphate glycosyltransferase